MCSLKWGQKDDAPSFGDGIASQTLEAAEGIYRKLFDNGRCERQPGRGSRRRRASCQGKTRNPRKTKNIG